MENRKIRANRDSLRQVKLMTPLKNIRNTVACLAMLLIGLFTGVSVAVEEAARPPWKIAVLRTPAPYAAEIEQGLREGMAQLGYVEGQNLIYLPPVVVKARIEDFAETAALVKLKLAEAPDLFVSIGTQASVPAWSVLESTGIPLVFSAVTFPVEGGLIAAYGQPTGKNITGLGYSVSPRQRLEVLRQMFPDVKRFQNIAFVYSGQVLQDATYVKYLRAAGEVAKWRITYIDYFDYAQNNPSQRLLIDKLEQSNPDLVFGWYDLDILGRDSPAFAGLLDRLHKPLIALTSKGLAEGAIGGVFTNHQWLGEQQAAMIDQIFQGKNPGEIPPIEPTTCLIGLNLQKARQLDVPFEQKLIESASQVIR